MENGFLNFDVDEGWTYIIPEGFEAEIKDGKVIVREKESMEENSNPIDNILNLEKYLNARGNSLLDNRKEI